MRFTYSIFSIILGAFEPPRFEVFFYDQNDLKYAFPTLKHHMLCFLSQKRIWNMRFPYSIFTIILGAFEPPLFEVVFFDHTNFKYALPTLKHHTICFVSQKKDL